MKHAKHSIGMSARKFGRQGLYAVLLIVAAAAPAHAAFNAAMLPPLTQAASGEHHVGKVVWADLVTPDLNGAKRFYRASVGGTLQDVPGERNYAVALLDGAPPIPHGVRGVSGHGGDGNGH